MMAVFVGQGARALQAEFPLFDADGLDQVVVDWS
jgi:hypothetical protein